MTYSSDNPFSYSNAMSKNSGIVPMNASRMALDNLLRRELKVGDPNNSEEIAQALLARYKGTPKATAIIREAEGVPFLTTPTTAPIMQGMTSSDAEMQQAVDDVNRDLQELTTNTILKDITPELQGWAVAIQSAIMEGFNAARFALDSRQRDKTFGIRRTLGDYARIARLVGALSPSVVNINYRKLAQSIDEVTSVLLVLMGESLANVSFNRSRYLLQVPYSELQSRRDSVIYALRHLNGTTQEAYAPNEWPRGVDGYRQLYKYLEMQGQGDLRSLLVENELSRIIDSLIQRAGQGNADGLRHLGATAQLDIQRLRRLVNIINPIISQNAGMTPQNAVTFQAINPKSPPLTSFLEALQLFIDAFEGSGGFRLLRLARPPILFYGLYGGSTSDQDAENRLVDLAIERNRLAELLDCFLQCGCTPDRIKCQIALDKILYDVDRAIDLYALGTTENREPEYRAVAYSYVIDAVLFPELSTLTCLSDDQDRGLNDQIRTTLTLIRKILFSPIPYMLPTIPLEKLPTLMSLPLAEIILPLISQELRIQGDMESRWQDLVQSMASTCLPFTITMPNGANLRNAMNNNNLGVFDVTKKVLQIALFRVTGDSTNLNIDFRIEQSSNLPEQYEISLAASASASASINNNLGNIKTNVDEILMEIKDLPIPPSPPMTM